MPFFPFFKRASRDGKKSKGTKDNSRSISTSTSTSRNDSRNNANISSSQPVEAQAVSDADFAAAGGDTESPRGPGPGAGALKPANNDSAPPVTVEAGAGTSGGHNYNPSTVSQQQTAGDEDLIGTGTVTGNRERRYSTRDLLQGFLSRSMRISNNSGTNRPGISGISGISGTSGISNDNDSSAAGANSISSSIPLRGNAARTPTHSSASGEQQHPPAFSSLGSKLRRSKSTRQTQLPPRPQSLQNSATRAAASPSNPRTAPSPQPSDTSHSTKSPVNSNKPLPSTPIESEQETDSPPASARPVLKLHRIMMNLNEADVEKLFSGAPQYFARSEGHFTGAPHPSVAFPWDEELYIRDLTDHMQIEDEAWGCITAWPHITRDIHKGPSASATRKVAEKRRAHFYPRCRERPNMLSMQGLEKGTMGYQAALELSVADALQEEQWGFDSLGAKHHVIVEARQALLTSKDGLRRLEETTILDQLTKNGERYQETHDKDKQSCFELHKELFTQILHPPYRTLADPYSLPAQVQALLKVLAAPNVWVDFSHVEWRIRLGQILWGAPAEDEVADGASISDAEAVSDLQEERYWLLLQILLACELLVRLDAITEGDELPENLRPADIHRFEKDANKSVKWSLHLARVWLENIEIMKVKPSETGQNGQPKGWLANLTQKMALSNERPHSKHHHTKREQPHIYVMRGTDWERQAHGLTHFARRLKWPDIESHTTRIADNCRTVSEGTPLNSPGPLPSPVSMKSNRSSYFGGQQKTSAGTLKRQPSRRQKVGAALHPAGWLSKSYVSGLMLPGEGLYHFIMSTLIENDIGAMQALGPMANLCGGFVYYGKSFWSTACVVGRVLAAGKGAVECMGWISSDVTPLGLGDGWVNIDVEDIPEDVKHTNKQARLWGKLAIERESSVLGGSDPSSVLPADFIIPFENIYKEPPPTISVELKSLNFVASAESVETTPTVEFMTPYSEFTITPDIVTYSPAINFSITHWEQDEDRDYTFSIAKDVYFVTAHPCVPSHHVKILKSPSSPTIQHIDLSGSGVPGKSTSSAKVTGHPLHKYFTYTAIHLSELLEKPTWNLNQFLSDTCPNTRRPSVTPAASSKIPRVLVIDAITNFIPQPEAHEIPLSPVTSRASTNLSTSSQSSFFPERDQGSADFKMHSETRRRQFGSDMEIMVRAICAEKGWNAIISRRRRGCLACAIREAGALGWRVVIRVN